MAFQIHVQLKGSDTPIYSPDFGSREEAEADLAKIREVVGFKQAANVTWMAAEGTAILGAHVIESGGFE